MDDQVIASIQAAVEPSPGDVPLRLHLAELLVGAGRGSEAVQHLAAVLAADPGSGRARDLMAAAHLPRHHTG